MRHATRRITTRLSFAIFSYRLRMIDSREEDSRGDSKQLAPSDALVGVQVDLLVLDRPPQALDEHVVAPRALAVHADPDLLGCQHAREGRAGELRALIRVEDRPPHAGDRHALLRHLAQG